MKNWFRRLVARANLYFHGYCLKHDQFKNRITGTCMNCRLDSLNQIAADDLSWSLARQKSVDKAIAVLKETHGN